MKKISALIIIAILIIGFYYEDMNGFYLRGTDLKLMNQHTKHQYIIDSVTGQAVVGEHIVDIYRINKYVLIQRIVATTYDCGKRRLMFTHYKDELEVAIFNRENRKFNYYTEDDFMRWLKTNKFDNPFNFEGHYSNEERYQKLNETEGCVQ